MGTIRSGLWAGDAASADARRGLRRRADAASADLDAAGCGPTRGAQEGRTP
jgi:hypothetical protein